MDGHEDIFSVGDCADVNEAKLAFSAGEQAIHLFKNLKKYLADKDMEPYKPGTVMI